MRSQHEELRTTESTAQGCRASCKDAALEKARASWEAAEMRIGSGGGGQPAAEYHQHITRQGPRQNQEVLDSIAGRSNSQKVQRERKSRCLRVSGQDHICKEVSLT